MTNGSSVTRDSHRNGDSFHKCGHRRHKALLYLKSVSVFPFTTKALPPLAPAGLWLEVHLSTWTHNHMSSARLDCCGEGDQRQSCSQFQPRAPFHSTRPAPTGEEAYPNCCPDGGEKTFSFPKGSDELREDSPPAQCSVADNKE